jgi:hydrogenase-4 membrane subunit HyfE
VQGIWTALLTLTGSYGQLLNYVIFAALVFYVLTTVALFRLRAKRPEMERPYKAFGYPLVPALYLVAALALAIILLGFLMMIVRRNAVTQIVGFMSMENGLILAATGARGMPLVVEVSVAFSVLIALFVFAVFVFRIRERFDTVDIEALDRMRGDRR